VIIKIRHKGLRLLFEKGITKGVPAAQVTTLRNILARLNIAAMPKDMALPGWGLHPLKGDRKGFWAVWVTGNDRVIWRFIGTDADDVDYLDYHKK
jgi:proteic killer suppression protein